MLELPLELQLEVLTMVVEDLVETCADSTAVEVAGAAEFGHEVEAIDDGNLGKEGETYAFVVETVHAKGIEKAGLVCIDARLVIVCMKIS